MLKVKNSCLVDNGCQSGCTNTNAGVAGVLSYGAKIGIITGSVVAAVSLIIIGFLMFRKHQKRKQKSIDIDSDQDSGQGSGPDTGPVLISVPNPNLCPSPAPNKICMRCLETRPVVSDFPRRRITSGCNHEPGICH